MKIKLHAASYGELQVNARVQVFSNILIHHDPCSLPERSAANKQISIIGAKAELSPAMLGEAMVTMNITNQGGADVLTRVTTDIPGAKASFHVMEGDRMVNADTVKCVPKAIWSLRWAAATS